MGEYTGQPSAAQALFAELLKRRQIDDVATFARPDYEATLHDPWLMPDMKAACSRLKQALKDGQLVAIYGDYDIDGMTATTVLLKAFKAFGVPTTYFIPDRFKDGYGLSQNGVDELAKRGAAVIVTVDCGTLSHEQISYAKSRDIDVIVTDHHEPGETLPADAVAILNPKRHDSTYPFRELAGVGVAFKLVQALQQKLEGLPAGQEKWLLDLVALGTVCDIVPLTDENRTFVYWGLQVLRRGKRPGLSALATVARVELERLNAGDLGFRLGPRLNAAGRVETAQHSLDLLHTDDGQEATRLAWRLEELNRERRDQQAKIEREAFEQAEQLAADDVLVLSGTGWSHGVIGIVAARVLERFQKPTLVLEDMGELSKGSARSYGGFHLADAFKANKKLFVSAGGHALAAGCTLKTVDVPKLRQALNRYYQDQGLVPDKEREQLLPICDLELNDFAGVTEELIELMEQLAPYGQGHKQPLFRWRGQVVSRRALGADGKHMRLELVDGNGETRSAIAFGLAERLAELDQPELVFHVETNEWNGRVSLQLRVTHVTP